jgi:quinol monooxygenase YgiN
VKAYERDPQLASLLADEYFADAVSRGEQAWRRVVSTAALSGVPVPGFASSLSPERLPAALIQGQRGFFGRAHLRPYRRRWLVPHPVVRRPQRDRDHALHPLTAPGSLGRCSRSTAAGIPDRRGDMTGENMFGTASPYVTVLWEVRARQGKDSEVRAVLTDIVTEVHHDPRCIDYEAHEVEGQPGTFIIVERWESRASLEEHQQTSRMQELTPQLVPLLAGAVEDGLRLLHPLRPAHTARRRTRHRGHGAGLY